MPSHRGVARGLSVAVTLALGLWIFRGPMPDMVMGGMLTVAGSGRAVVRAAGTTSGHATPAGNGGGLCIGCCPGSSTPPPNPPAFDFAVAPQERTEQRPAPAPRPRRAAPRHRQPPPIGPPAPLLG